MQICPHHWYTVKLLLSPFCLFSLSLHKLLSHRKDTLVITGSVRDVDVSLELMSLNLGWLGSV